MESLNYKISWDGFNDHIINAFNQLKNRTEFSDVTLACDDGRKFSAHKMVLRSSSSVLREILSDISLNGSLIFLRGINHKCLEALLDFLYQGEVDIPSSRQKILHVRRTMKMMEKKVINMKKKTLYKELKVSKVKKKIVNF